MVFEKNSVDRLFCLCVPLTGNVLASGGSVIPSFIDCRIHKGLARKLPPIIFDHREAIDALINDLNG